MSIFGNPITFGGGSSDFENVLKGIDTPAIEDGKNGAIYLKYIVPPAGYEALEYLEAAGNQSIDTGIDLTSQTYFELRGAYTSNTNNNNLYGFGYSNNENNINVYNNRIYNVIGNSGCNIAYDSNIHFFAAASAVSTIDTTTGTPNWSGAVIGQRIRLFATAYGGTFDSNRISYGKIYYCKMYSGSTLIRSFIPVKRKSDNELGMYDLVNDVFYINDGSGSFTAGPISTNTVQSTYAKVSNNWQSLIGTNADNIYFGKSNKLLLRGTTDPTSEDGENGQIYLKTDEVQMASSGQGWYVQANALCTSTTSMGTINGRNYYKVTNEPAIVFFTHGIGSGYWQPMIASTIATACSYNTSDGGGPWNYDYSYVINGVTWYFFSGSYGFTSPSINTTFPIVDGTDVTTQVGAEAMLAKAYTIFTQPKNNYFYPIISSYAKVSSTWQTLIGTNINDIDPSSGSSTNVLSGTSIPTSTQGRNGSMYLQYIDSSTVLPTGYTMLESIGLTGTQYVDTGVPANTTDLKIEIEYKPTSGYTSEQAVFGADWSTTGYFLMLYNGKWRFHSKGGVVDDGTANTNDYSTIVTTPNQLTVNGTDYVVSGSSANSANNIYFGYLSYQGGKGAVGTLKHMKIWSDTTLLHDYYPALDANNVVCLYDIVGAEPIYNSGSGSFVAGSSIDNGKIISTYAKTGGAWQDLIGTNINDIDLGGGGDTNYGIIMGDFVYALPLSDGGSWISTGFTVNDADNFIFYNTASDVFSGQMASISKDDIPVAGNYRTIFKNNGVDFNIQQSEGILYVSFNGSGASSYVTNVYTATAALPT